MQKRFPHNIATAWLFLFIVLFTSVFTATFLISKVENDYFYFMSATISYLLTLFFVILINKYFYKVPFKIFEIKKNVISLIPFLIIFFFLFLNLGLSNPIYRLIPELPFENKTTNITLSYTYLLTSVVVTPVFEELLYRKFLFKGLMRRYSMTKSLIVSSFIFAVIHLSPQNLIPTFLLGISLAWIYYNTENIWLCIIGHSTYNATVLFFNSYFKELYTSLNSSKSVFLIAPSILLLILTFFVLKKKFVEIKSSS